MNFIKVIIVIDHIFNKHITNDTLINDEMCHYSFEELSDKNTFYASGLNFDYLLILVNKKNNVYVEEFTIDLLRKSLLKIYPVYQCSD